MLGGHYEGAVIPSGTGSLARVVWFYVAPAFRRASFIFPGFENRSIRQHQHKLGWLSGPIYACGKIGHARNVSARVLH
jgi:hypothetical protein